MTWIRHILPQITGVHRWLYVHTGGWIGASAIGFRFLLLEHVGRKTGQRRLTPILYVPDGERFVMAASNAGQDRHPAWWLNLQAQPEVTIRVGRRVIAVKARRASDAELARLWPLLTSSWRWFDEYSSATDREIPVVVLEPEADSL